MDRRERRKIKNRDKKTASIKPQWYEYKNFLRAIVRKEIDEELITYEQWVKRNQKKKQNEN